MSAGGRGRGEGGRRAPRRLGGALDRLVAEDAPQTLLAAVQGAWPQACGEAIAARSEPVSERNGTVTIACESGPWAQELELMGDLLRERVEAIVGPDRVAGFRFTADLSRHR
jgi:predicted nucleic acid-binding Zn ribbon protein